MIHWGYSACVITAQVFDLGNGFTYSYLHKAHHSLFQFLLFTVHHSPLS